MTKMPNNVVLLGLGSKARNGKDSTATFIKEFEPNVHILHWADKLYEEVKNEGYEEHKMPLCEINNDEVWCLKEVKNEGRRRIIIYDKFTHKELPKFRELILSLKDREDFKYSYMLDKDPLLLQLWGTDLRRTHFGNDYWIDRTFEDINRIVEENKNYDGLVWICIADTRFRNEATAIRMAGGIYVDVIRLNPDDTRFVAPDRDPNHPSEADLNDTKPDIKISAYNLDTLSTKVKGFILTIKQQRQI